MCSPDKLLDSWGMATVGNCSSDSGPWGNNQQITDVNQKTFETRKSIHEELRHQRRPAQLLFHVFLRVIPCLYVELRLSGPLLDMLDFFLEGFLPGDIMGIPYMNVFFQSSKNNEHAFNINPQKNLVTTRLEQDVEEFFTSCPSLFPLFVDLRAYFKFAWTCLWCAHTPKGRRQSVHLVGLGRNHLPKERVDG